MVQAMSSSAARALPVLYKTANVSDQKDCLTIFIQNLKKVFGFF